MTTSPKRLTKQNRLAMLDVIDRVNSAEITSLSDLSDHLTENDLPEWFAEWTLWSAGENMPGYLPESPYCLFLTERAAIGYCRELEREEGHSDGGYVSDYMPISLRDILS